jgi:predicted transcriptional regulator
MSTELLPGFEPTGVLLSLRPAFASLIASGAKTVELRRRFPKLPTDSVLVLYVTKPIAAVVGLARLHSVTKSRPPKLWRRFGRACAVSKATFDSYFRDCEEGTALEVKDYRPFPQALNVFDLRTHWPEFSPPQSFRYVPDAVLRLLRTLAFEHEARLKTGSQRVRRA